ncbi:MAG: ribonuclease III [Eubacteriales bacterium]|nr:ribonuclease III [Eubacteriales bacterium]
MRGKDNSDKVCIDGVARQLQKNAGYSFHDGALLLKALTHSSFANEAAAGGLKQKDNERLEFLGDAVLGMAVSNILFNLQPSLPEGEMTKIKARTVCEPALAECAYRIGLPGALILGKGEEMSGGRAKNSIISDAFEALIGAIYLDGGLKEAEKFIRDHVWAGIIAADEGIISGRPVNSPATAVVAASASASSRASGDANIFSSEGGCVPVAYAEASSVRPVFKDYKTELQELIQKNGNASAEYRIVRETGPGHDKHFYAEVLEKGIVTGSGDGKSKKEAEQNAARQALLSMHNAECAAKGIPEKSAEAGDIVTKAEAILDDPAGSQAGSVPES